MRRADAEQQARLDRAGRVEPEDGNAAALLDLDTGWCRYPPAIAGRITSVSASFTGVSSPSSTRTSSSLR